MALPTLDIEVGSLANTGKKSEFLDANFFFIFDQYWGTCFFYFFFRANFNFSYKKHFSSIMICH